MGNKDASGAIIDKSKKGWITITSDAGDNSATPDAANGKATVINSISKEKWAANGQPALAEAMGGKDRPGMKERAALAVTSISSESSSSSAPVAGDGETVERKKGMLDRLTSIVHPKIAAATIFVILLLTTQHIWLHDDLLDLLLNLHHPSAARCDLYVRLNERGLWEAPSFIPASIYSPNHLLSTSFSASSFHPVESAVTASAHQPFQDSAAVRPPSTGNVSARLRRAVLLERGERDGAEGTLEEGGGAGVEDAKLGAGAGAGAAAAAVGGAGTGEGVGEEGVAGSGGAGSTAASGRQDGGQGHVMATADNADESAASAKATAAADVAAVADASKVLSRGGTTEEGGRLGWGEGAEAAWLAMAKKGKLVEVGEEGPGRVHLKALLVGLAGTAVAENSNPLIIAFARLAERYLEPWTAIEGVTTGFGSRGHITPTLLATTATHEKLSPCTMHIRVVNGRVFFRYGSFLEDAKKLRRANLAAKLIVDAVTEYKLRDLRSELFINVCDSPISFTNSLSQGKSGRPYFSMQWTPGVTDIPFPDPLDLDFTPVHPSHHLHPWKKKESRAAWRGHGFEFRLQEVNWVSSPRIRLHLMSNLRPKLLDARLSGWGPKDMGAAKRALIMAGIRMALDHPEEEMQGKYKYRVVLDGQVGHLETCSALAADQVTIRQSTGFSHALDPLLLPGFHFIPAKRNFDDLIPTLEWMSRNDDSMHFVIRNANRAARMLCTWRSRVLYTAVLLLKYTATALTNASAVEEPLPCPGGQAIQSAGWVTDSKQTPACQLSAREIKQLAKEKVERGEGSVPPLQCSDFCVKDKEEDKWTWLEAESALKELRVNDPLADLNHHHHSHH